MTLSSNTLRGVSPKEAQLWDIQHTILYKSNANEFRRISCFVLAKFEQNVESPQNESSTKIQQHFADENEILNQRKFEEAKSRTSERTNENPIRRYNYKENKGWFRT